MKTSMMAWKGAVGLGALLLSATLLPAFVAAPAQAQRTKRTADPAEKPGHQVAITVLPFKDEGGANQQGVDGKPLTERLPGAYRMYLAQFFRGRCHVVGIDGDAPKELPKYTVEGELSQIESDEATNRRYLLVVRVFREGQSRRLVAQFAGKVPFRLLTGGLDRNSREPNGLVGRMAKETGEAALNSVNSSGDLSEMIRMTTAIRRLTVDVMVQGEQTARQQVTAGEKYQLRVSSQDPGAVYILKLDAKSVPTAPYAQTEPLDAAPNQPVLLPPNSMFEAPVVTEPASQEYLVLLRRKGPGPTESMPGTPEQRSPASDPEIPNPAPTTTQVQPPGAPLKVVVVRPEKSQPGFELITMTAPQVTADPQALSLLRLWQGDPKNTWHGVRVNVVFVPAK